jgi:hypothetical protein
VLFPSLLLKLQEGAFGKLTVLPFQGEGKLAIFWKVKRNPSFFEKILIVLEF